MNKPRSKFCVGENILCREIDVNGYIADVRPVIVVEDSDDRLVFWLPLGTPTKQAVLLDHKPGTPRRWEDGNWELIDNVWKWSDPLIIVRPEDFHATWVVWSAEQVFTGWYVNMQSNLTRTSLGFDLTDHQLDIVVDPDRNWQQKDQDELDVNVEQGRLTPEQVKEIRSEGQWAVEEIESNRGVFSEEWKDWRPDA